MTLKGHVYFLTGAAGGLGSALTLKLCEQGADVIVSDKNPKALNNLCDAIVERNLPEPIVYPMNLMGATPDDFIKLSNTIEEKLGKLDALIHTATEFSSLTPFQHYEPTRWLKEMQVNLNAPLFLTQSLLPLLLKQKGTVIFTLDDKDLIESAYWGNYGVSKAAVASFATMLQKEMANQGVRVETITPPPMRTQHRIKAWPGEASDHLAQPIEIAESYMQLLMPNT
ncbi:SDR family NAD(P)-dependent oxidoreductase [Marinicella sp. W31]|uniref:SDR family NAD(P)-dependent oxidoreductase n=1 Tax=Marinicella sp. W31 TaxID=3023713 RepID=UPI0037570AAF